MRLLVQIRSHEPAGLYYSFQFCLPSVRPSASGIFFSVSFYSHQIWNGQMGQPFVALVPGYTSVKQSVCLATTSLDLQ